MLAPGTTIGRYVVKRKLAEGGMAEIYLAAAQGAEGFSKEVVIKVVRSFLTADRQFIDMFLSEAKLGSQLNHANVVQIFDFGKHEDMYYLAMEFVRGASLWDLRRRCREVGTPFPVTLAAEVCAQVAKGLQYAHTVADQGVPLNLVHRDVTPHNVLLSFDGAVKLTDFGIAKAGTSHTAPGMLKGKFAYMSPEQARGERVDARTDIFALGIVLWELLTGGRLFDGDSDVAVLRSVQESAITPPARLNPDVPDELSQIALKALSRTTKDRFQTAFELERALAMFVLKSAKTVEDTNVGRFMQELFKQEYDADHRQTRRLPPVEASRTQQGPDTDADYEMAHGATLAVDRSGSKGTMTATPVQNMPRNATPSALGGVIPKSAAGPQAPTTPMRSPQRETDELSSADPNSTDVRKPKTEKMPSLKVLPSPEPTRTVRTSEQSVVSKTEPASEGELPVVPRSKVPMAVALLGFAAIGGVGAFVLLSSNEKPAAPVTVPTLVKELPPIETAPVAAPVVAPPPKVEPVEQADAGAAPVAVVDAGAPVVAAIEPPKPTEAPKPVVEPPKLAVAKPVAVKAATAVVTIQAIPYANVSVDGKSAIEVQGKRDLSLSAGNHVLSFSHSAWQSKLALTVQPNVPVTVKFDAKKQVLVAQ